MEKSEIKGFIAKRCAKELKNGDVVNLGIGLPTLIPNYLPKDVELIIHAELGIVSAGKSPKEGDDNYDPYHVVDAGGSPSSVAFGGGFIDSASNFGLIRGGHVAMPRCSRFISWTQLVGKKSFPDISNINLTGRQCIH